jgi:SiaC family regulatory phosphoprotein
MEKLYIKPSFKSPKIEFDPENNFYEIAGRSLPEDVTEIYEPVFEWVDKYIPELSEKIKLIFKIDYLNSASAKMISMLLNKLEGYYQAGAQIVIIWYYDPDDEDFIFEIENFSSFTKIPFKLVPFDEHETTFK